MTELHPHQDIDSYLEDEESFGIPDASTDSSHTRQMDTIHSLGYANLDRLANRVLDHSDLNIHSRANSACFWPYLFFQRTLDV